MSRICLSLAKCSTKEYFTCLMKPRYTNCSRLLFTSARRCKSSLQNYKGKDEVSADVKPMGEKVKETAKTTSYLGVILIGVGVTAAMFYTIFSELFSSKSPNSVYSSTFEKCISDPQIQDLLGTPIKGYGEQTRRGRRGHVSHLVYEKEGKKYLRMKFYIQGLRNKATVHLEMQENDRKDYEYRYLIVQVDDFRRSNIVLEDNRESANINASLQKYF